MNRKFTVTVAAAILLGCVSEQELREQAMTQEVVAKIRTCMAEGKYDEATRLCDETQTKCVKFKYDWDSARKVVVMEKEKSRRAEYDAWRVSDDGDSKVTIDEFESKFKQGWRVRAESKKASRIAKEKKEREERLAREAKEREEAERKAAEEARQRRIAAEMAKRKAEREAQIVEVYSNSLMTVRKSYSGKCVSPYPHPKADVKMKELEKNANEKSREMDRLKDAGKKDTDEYKKVQAEWFKLYKQVENLHWTQCWVDSRLELSEEDKLAGDAILSEFGTRYLPKAYAAYERKRDAAKELQQVYNEEFPNPGEMSKYDPKWVAYNKVLEKLARLRAEYFVSRDEICHYWVLYQFGIVTADYLREEDARGLSAKMYPENIEQLSYTQMDFPGFDKTFDFPPPTMTNSSWSGEVADFAIKYAPECGKIAQRLSVEAVECTVQFYKVQSQRNKMDDIRYSRAMMVAVRKCREICDVLSDLKKTLDSWRTDYRTTLKSGEDVQKLDHEKALKLKLFMTELPNYLKSKATGPIIFEDEMIAVPDRNYKIQRTEVTQWQWILVMGKNPSEIKGLWHPVENVSREDVLTFISRLNELDDKRVDVYRLPTLSEWKCACLAGGKGKWGLLANGKEGKWYELGVIGGTDSWAFKSQLKRHGMVASRMPNAWGIYDMHGNVAEYCHEKDQGALGGSWKSCDEKCTCESSTSGYASDSVGFRLASPVYSR